MIDNTLSYPTFLFSSVGSCFIYECMTDRDSAIGLGGWNPWSVDHRPEHESDGRQRRSQTIIRRRRRDAAFGAKKAARVRHVPLALRPRDK